MAGTEEEVDGEAVAAKGSVGTGWGDDGTVGAAVALVVLVAGEGGGGRGDDGTTV